ncbi:flavodoxin family protein [Flaviflexus salsibiostraticola]|uniref:Flavodoxin family protein n=1 Tax=Flaviflexus salsibiostraticola TaxID=1282737 RepID=A0A3Q8WT76_9ACTO|nr:flavodoxin family protein [Flaviflexus salsibiostraticola]AZN29762.1 flavodoxin family protein [Flaviflexus salsibiostraticola]
MKAMVIYESAWGNTRTIADAIAEGLDTDPPISVEHADPLSGLKVDLLVLGGPTHAFGLSRASTREDAHRRGGELLRTGLREWIEEASSSSLRVAIFDTKVHRPNLPGSAGKSASRKLHRIGCRVVAGPEHFLVEDYGGPLLPGEVDRAREWGRDLRGVT